MSFFNWIVYLGQWVLGLVWVSPQDAVMDTLPQDAVKTTLPLHTPVYSDRVRFVCISDTHAQAEKIRKDLPPGDVLVHAGDFTNTGTPNEVTEFNTFLGKLPYRHKIVIAGNHELSFDPHYMTLEGKRLELDCPIRIDPIAVKDFLVKEGVSSMKELLTNCVYLEDSEVRICGLRIYGSPWTEDFCDWGFSLKTPEDCIATWARIPKGIDILVTHGPPLGQGDNCVSENEGGCRDLRKRVAKVVPKYHVFGHIHEDYGTSTNSTRTVFINASTCTKQITPTNKPIIFDIPLPPGYTKDDMLHEERTHIGSHVTKF